MLEKVSKENNNVELGEEEDFGDEAITVVSATSSITVVSATSSITSSATSSVTLIQQNLPSASTPIQPTFSESTSKKSRDYKRLLFCLNR